MVADSLSRRIERLEGLASDVPDAARERLRESAAAHPHVRAALDYMHARGVRECSVGARHDPRARDALADAGYTVMFWPFLPEGECCEYFTFDDLLRGMKEAALGRGRGAVAGERLLDDEGTGA